MALTDTKIRNAKPGRLTDGQGLYLLVKAKGKGWWRLDYKLSNSRKTLTMGTYPEVSLAMARTRREEARQLIASGIDPSEERKAAKAASSGENSFETIAREWHASQLAKWSDDHAERVLCRLKSNVFPMIGARPISAYKSKSSLTAIGDSSQYFFSFSNL